MKSTYNGIIVVNKPTNLTSRDVVNHVSKILNIKKIGHTGTLDPIATGVLILTLGVYTKLSETITSTFKIYTVEAKLGYETDTLDNTGIITKTSTIKPNNETILKVINSFIGEYNQEVPAYSAVKIDGKKLYEYARENKIIELPKRKVIIKSISNIIINDNNIKFTCEVSKGTYIRSLIRDIGLKLNTFATMTKLNRDFQSGFSINNANTLEEIEQKKFKLYTIHDIFKDIYIVNCNEQKYKKVYNGVIQKENTNCDYVLYKYNKEDIALYKKTQNNYKMYIKLVK